MIAGPCIICGAENYPLSMGGPTICPSCDCGDFGIAKVQRQAEEIAQLRGQIADARATIDDDEHEIARLRANQAPLAMDDQQKERMLRYEIGKRDAEIARLAELVRMQELENRGLRSEIERWRAWKANEWAKHGRKVCG